MDEVKCDNCRRLVERSQLIRVRNIQGEKAYCSERCASKQTPDDSHKYRPSLRKAGIRT